MERLNEITHVLNKLVIPEYSNIDFVKVDLDINEQVKYFEVVYGFKNMEVIDRPTRREITDKTISIFIGLGYKDNCAISVYYRS